ncbi:uncharacterized protein LOC144406222 [Gasterosteus aculeatus]
MVVDFRRNRAPPSPITLCDSPVTIVDSFRFLGSIITQDLKWELNISSITKKAQQRLFFLRQLKKLNLPKTMMVHFYTAIIESILCSSITVWYAAATAKDKGRLQRVIRSAERVIGCNLPSLQDLFASRSLKRAKKIAADPLPPRTKTVCAPSIWQEAEVHQDYDLPPHEQFLPVGSRAHQQSPVPH